MNGILRTDLSPEQLLLLEEAFTPWDRAGRWPLWTYIDQRLDAKGLVAADVLASLPTIGSLWGAGSRYELTWYQHSGNRTPNADTPMALTVAGRGTPARHRAVAHGLQGHLEIPGGEAKKHHARAIRSDGNSRDQPGAGALDGPEWPVCPRCDIFARKVGQLLEHEPYLWHGFWRPDPSADQWEVKISASIRDYRDVTTIEEYIDRVEQLVKSA